MTTVAAFMTRTPRTIAADASLDEARSEMECHGIRHLPVVAGDELVGLLSSRDLAGGRAGQVRQVMSPRPYTANPADPIDKVAAHMAAFKIGSAVVVEDGEIVGIFTSHDAARALFMLGRERSDT